MARRPFESMAFSAGGYSRPTPLLVCLLLLHAADLTAQPPRRVVSEARARAVLPTVQAPPDFTWDFETGDLRGWEASGAAFATQPTVGDNPTARGRGMPSNHQGDYWVGTFERFQGRPGQRPGAVQGDEPTGTLTSRQFIVPGGELTFLIGGGSDDATRVELIVYDPIEQGEYVALRATGRNSETMRRVTWNLDQWRGREARLRVIDESDGPWGHINVDDFQFSAWMTEVPDLRGAPVIEAERQLPEYRLRLGEVRPVTSDAEPGTIIGQSPPPDSRVRIESLVDVEVARAEAAVTVPDLTGILEEDVAEILAEARLGLEGVERRPAPAPQGTVVEQSPPPGARAAPGDFVVVAVADPELVEVPELRRRLRSEALALIRRAGLRVAAAGESAGDATVIGQDPPAGAAVPRGSLVALELQTPVTPEGDGARPWWPFAALPLLALVGLGLALRLKRRPPRPPAPRQLRTLISEGEASSRIESGRDPIGAEIRLRVAGAAAVSVEVEDMVVVREELLEPEGRSR